MRSRSSRLPMSPATRRSASARWSRWATSSACWAPVTIAPRPSAATRAMSRSRGPSEPGVSPTMSRTPQGACWPGIATASSGRPSAKAERPTPSAVSSSRMPGSGARLVRSRPAARSSVLPKRPKRAGRSTSRCGPGDVGGGEDARHDPVAAPFPGGDEMMAVGVPDRPDGRLEGVVEIVPGVDQAADRRCDGQVEPVALHVERVGRDRLVPMRRRREPGGAGRIDGAPAAPGRRSGRPRRRRRRRSRPRPGSAGGHPVGSGDPPAD